MLLEQGAPPKLTRRASDFDEKCQGVPAQLHADASSAPCEMPARNPESGPVPEDGGGRAAVADAGDEYSELSGGETERTDADFRSTMLQVLCVPVCVAGQLPRSAVVHESSKLVSTS